MSRRSAQSAAVLVLVLGVAIFLWGCGFGESATTTLPTGSDLPPATVATPAKNPVESPLGKPVPVTGDTPTAYTEAVRQGRPVVILFYVPGNVDDAKVLESLATLQSEFTDYAFLTYDFRNPRAYGDLSLLLKVNYPPELVFVDRAGIVRSVWNGWVDEGTLRQCLVNLGQG